MDTVPVTQFCGDRDGIGKRVGRIASPAGAQVGKHDSSLFQSPVTDSGKIGKRTSEPACRNGRGKYRRELTMINCLIEHGDFIAPCAFETQEQLDRFLVLGKQESDNMDEFMKEQEDDNLPVGCAIRYCFEYRESLVKTEAEEEWDRITSSGCAPFTVYKTTVYPESVIKDSPVDFVDKRANWEQRLARHWGNDGINDLRFIDRQLARAEQVRKDLPKVPSGELSDTDKRNKFIYELAQDIRLTWQDVCNEVHKEFNGMVVVTDAAERAARDYCKKYNLPDLPKRNPGRRPGSIPKSHDK